MARIPFGPDDEKNIRQTALLMKISGALAMFGAVFGVVGSVAVNLYTNLPAVSSLCSGAVSILVHGCLAVMLLMSANAFEKIVDTDGEDQQHLADGLSKLRFYFMSKAVLWVLGMLSCCAFVALFMMMGAAITAAFAGS